MKKYSIISTTSIIIIIIIIIIIVNIIIIYGLPGKGFKTQKPKSMKPEGCKKLFMGNLSFDIDDDTVVAFFKSCGNMVGLRWLTHRDSGEFRVRRSILKLTFRLF